MRKGIVNGGFSLWERPSLPRLLQEEMREEECLIMSTTLIQLQESIASADPLPIIRGQKFASGITKEAWIPGTII
jgi:hypothetical protein